MNVTPREGWLLLLPDRPTAASLLQSDGIVAAGVMRGMKRPERLNLLRKCRAALRSGGVLWWLDAPDSPPLPDADLDLVGLKRADGHPMTVPEWCRSAPGWDPTLRTERLTPRARSTESTPLVSLIIMAFKPRWFEEALHSALAQTWPNMEVVIGDDHPGNAIRQIVERTDDPRIRYLRNPPPSSSQRNMLRCLSEARGEYVKFLDDDDTLHPECVTRLASCLQTFPTCSLASSYRQLIGSSGERLLGRQGKQWMSWVDAIVDGSSLAAFQLDMRVSLVGVPTSTMFRRADLMSRRPHAISFDGHPASEIGDVYMWTSLLSAGDLAYIATPLSTYRSHGQNETGRRRNIPVEWRRLQALAACTGIRRREEPPQIRVCPMELRPWWTPQTRDLWRRAHTLRRPPRDRLHAWLQLRRHLPHAPEVRIGLAKALLDAGAAVEAMRLLSATMSEFPGYLPAPALVARCAARLGQGVGGSDLFRTTAGQQGEWIQNRGCLMEGAVSLHEPHDLWLPVPAVPCRAELRLSHASPRALDIPLELTATGSPPRRVVLQAGGELSLGFTSPAGSAQIGIRVASSSPLPSEPAVRLGGYSLSLL